MLTENVSTLKIHKLTKEQYERERLAGRIDETALYLTPDNDDGGGASQEQLDVIFNEIEEIAESTSLEIDGLQSQLNTSVDSLSSAIANKASVQFIRWGVED